MVVGLIVILSAVWVLFDAKKIGVRKGLVTGIGNMEPSGWFFVVLLLWIIGLPAYLYYRGKFKQAVMSDVVKQVTASPPSFLDNAYRIILIVTSVVLGVMALAYFSGSWNKEGFELDHQQSPAAVAVLNPSLVPASEQKFIEAVSAAKIISSNAENDMQRGGIKAKRDREICEIDGILNVDNWIGQTKTIDSNSDGKGVLGIEISPGIVLATWNNSLSDIADNTLIKPGSSVFESASKMKKGQVVIFSGNLFKSEEGDCIREQSLTLRGKLENPEFTFKFSKIIDKELFRVESVRQVTKDTSKQAEEDAVDTKSVNQVPLQQEDSAISPEIRKLLEEEEALNEKCRDGSGDSAATLKSCDAREELFMKLKASGWCYGTPGDYENEKSWRKCQIGQPAQGANLSDDGNAESIRRAN